MGRQSDLGTDVRPESADPLAPGRKKGIDRRTLIKRAAATGAVAWTAPIILDSLASPAAAGTCGKIYRVTFNMLDQDKNYQPPNGTGSEVSPCANMSSVQSTAAKYAGNGDCDQGASVTPPGGYSATPIDLAKSLSPATACIDFGGSQLCGANFTNTNMVTATLKGACTAGVSGCNTPLAFLAAAISSQALPTGTGTLCQKRQLGGSTTGTAADSANHIPSLSTTSITFAQPGSTHPGHSGSYQFVIGCGCS